MNKKGTVYFFTGLSGAGKTTIGGLFFRIMKSKKNDIILLDGDLIRPVYCEDIGYSTEDRLKAARRTFRVCKMLSEQGIDVVMCGIAMYSEIREWNRRNIENYREIYIKVSKETLLKRNKKGLYTNGINVVGVDLPYDEPKRSDIVILNDGDRTPSEIVEELIKFLNLS